MSTIGPSNNQSSSTDNHASGALHGEILRGREAKEVEALRLMDSRFRELIKRSLSCEPKENTAAAWDRILTQVEPLLLEAVPRTGDPREGVADSIRRILLFSTRIEIAAEETSSPTSANEEGRSLIRFIELEQSLHRSITSKLDAAPESRIDYAAELREQMVRLRLLLTQELEFCTFSDKLAVCARDLQHRALRWWNLLSLRSSRSAFSSE